MFISHSKPLISIDDITEVTKVLNSGHIAQGRKVEELEREMAQYLGLKYGVAVSSGTSSLHLALIGLNVKKGDEVILPSYVCASPYLAILYTGATPKIVDITLSDFNICTTKIKQTVTPRTKAIIVPHMFGTPADLDGLLDLDVPIIEDCAQSLGSEYKKRKVGSFGRIGICSFYATKMITTGEGGMLLTDEYEIYNKINEVREYDKKPLDTLRYNYKMTDIQAALGLSQLKKLDYFIKRRREIAAEYTGHFSGCQITLPCMGSHKKSVFYRYVIQVKRLEHVQKVAKKKGIMCERPVWKPLHKSFDLMKRPNTDYVYAHALSIPLYPSLTEAEIDYIVKTLTPIFTANK